MTEPAAPDPVSPMASTPPERVRIDGPPPPKRMDALPLLYVLGFLVLAVSLFYLYRNPSLPEGAAQEIARVDTEQQQHLQTLTDRLTKVEQRPVATPAPSTAPLEARLATLEQRAAVPSAPAPNLEPIETRIAALERADANPPPPPSTAPLEARIAKLEQQAAIPPPPPVDIGPVTSRLDAVAAKQGSDLQGLTGRLDTLEGRIAAAEKQGSALIQQIGGVAERAQSVSRIQVAAAALAAGQQLGELPGAPPALRLSFDAAAEAAQHASQPAAMEDKPFASRMWNRAQQSVTIRQGDRMVAGDPVAGLLAHARQSLDAGDITGALSALDGLNGPAAAAMAGWTTQARSLLEARAALATMAARG